MEYWKPILTVESKNNGGNTAMKTMWAPWRMEYILDTDKDGCIFCKALTGISWRRPGGTWPRCMS